MSFDRITRYFESMGPANLDQLGTIYTDDAMFKDPFQQVRGVAAIRAIYAHMYESLETPRFVILGRWESAGSAVARWQLAAAGLRGRQPSAISIEGMTHFELAADGRINLHRDYWDAAEEVYEKVPMLGGLLRLLKRRLRAREG